MGAQIYRNKEHTTIRYKPKHIKINLLQYKHFIENNILKIVFIHIPSSNTGITATNDITNIFLQLSVQTQLLLINMQYLQN